MLFSYFYRTRSDTLNSIGSNPTVGGLSFYSYYGITTNVPDGASTVMRLGTAWLGMAAMVSVFKKEAVKA
jgi:hypothetical protein